MLLQHTIISWSSGMMLLPGATPAQGSIVCSDERGNRRNFYNKKYWPGFRLR